MEFKRAQIYLVTLIKAKYFFIQQIIKATDEERRRRSFEHDLNKQRIFYISLTFVLVLFLS